MFEMPGVTGDIPKNEPAEKLIAAIEQGIDELPADVFMKIIVGSFLGGIEYLAEEEGIDTNQPITLNSWGHRDITIHPRKANRPQ